MIRRLKRHWPWLGLVVLAVMVRVPLLFGLGTLWNDEAFSRHFALLPVKEALGYLTMDVHPPLHTVVLHFWMKILGPSALAMRSLSLVFAVAGLAAFLKLGRAFFGKKEALLSGVLFAVSPLMAYYGADARMYAMTFFLASLSSLLFWKIVEDDAGVTELWMWVSMALALTHLTGVMVLAAQALFLLISAERRPVFRKLFWKFVLIAIVFAVWLLPAAAFRLQFFSEEWQFRSGQEDLHVSMSLLDWVWLSRDKAWIAIAFAACGALMLAGILRKSDRPPHFNAPPSSVFLFVWLACVFVPFLAFPNVTPRYLIAAVPPLYLLLARGFVKVTGGGRFGLLAGAALACFLAVPGLSVQYAVRSYNWDHTAAWIQEHREPGDRVIFAWFADRLSIDELDDRELARAAEGAYGLYPFDDDFDVHERYVAHAGTLAITPEDLDRMTPFFDGAARVFFIPNVNMTIEGGDWADDEMAAWLQAHGWFLADRLPHDGRTQGVWLMVKKN